MGEKRGRRAAVAAALAEAPIIGVVRTASRDEGRRQAQTFVEAGLQLIEITFTIPEAVDLFAELLAQRQGQGSPWLGMGTVTDRRRAERAVAAGAEFLVSPNIDPEVAALAGETDRFLVLGALTPSEIVKAHRLGADMVKVYPLPPVGGPAYLATIRQPLDDIPMLAAGGFGVEEISAYKTAGAAAFGIGAPLLGATREESRQRITRALNLARG